MESGASMMFSSRFKLEQEIERQFGQPAFDFPNEDDKQKAVGAEKNVEMKTENDRQPNHR